VWADEEEDYEIGGHIVPHPYKKEYWLTLEHMIKLSQSLNAAEAKLEKIEKKYNELKRTLAKKYGPGVLHVKWVKNRRGKKYYYPVWRTDHGDIYIRHDKDEIIALIEERRKLRKYVKRLQKVISMMKHELQLLEPYKDVCIDMKRKRYVTCTQPLTREDFESISENASGSVSIGAPSK
jgi:succinyl-CoA synthetase beta subunit